jgi:molybdopterin/thiamine biosynthesis adenylyltransferase/rhodanese-related sulfurtransferase
MNLSPDEILRYSRHLALPGFGLEAQEKLKASKVVVVGAGGLGAPVLSYLTAAGVGEIGIIDFDTITLSNLQRQVLFTTKDIGSIKATIAVERLKVLNPYVTFRLLTGKLTRDNALTLLKDFEIIVDCTDNFPSRYLLNDSAVLLDVPLVYGSVFRYEGQVAVLNHHRGPNYRDLYPAPPLPGSVPDCESGGVLGVLPGIIGSIQANEVIKILTGIGEPLSSRLLLLDSLTMATEIILIPDQNQRKFILKLIDYEDFCGLSHQKKENWGMKEVTVQELKKMIDSKADFQLIDVREPHEYEVCNIGGELIPMAEIPSSIDKIATDKQVVIHCRSGKRSSDILLWLEKNRGLDNLYNLKGGILAWAKEIDTTMPTY